MIVLYNSDVCDYIDNNKKYVNEYMQENNIKDIYTAAYNLIDIDYYYLKDLLNSYCCARIRVFARLGLWYGIQTGRKDFRSLIAAFYHCCDGYDSIKIYFKNKNSTMTIEARHHDGVNLFKCYKVIKGKKYAIKYSDIMK